MEEDEFRATYRKVNKDRCVYEKAINNRHCGCRYSDKILLAGRECVACSDAGRLQLCSEFLKLVRIKAAFSVKRTQISGPLPHNDELKVQAGGIKGLSTLIGARIESINREDKSSLRVSADISDCIKIAKDTYAELSQIPFEKIIAEITNYSVRRRKSRK